MSRRASEGRAFAHGKVPLPTGPKFKDFIDTATGAECSTRCGRGVYRMGNARLAVAEALRVEGWVIRDGQLYCPSCANLSKGGGDVAAHARTIT